MIVLHAFRKVAPNLQLRAMVDGDAAIGYLAGRGPYGDREVNPVPQLVLLDLKLPKKSGFEVLEWIRKESGLKQLPVIILTSSAESGDLERAYALGANSYLVKSVDLKVMREILRGIGEYAELLCKTPADASLQRTP